MRRALAAAVVLALVGLALAGCTSGDRRATRDFVPGPGPSKVQVDTPELVQLKAETGLEDCAPGPKAGALPSITLKCLGGGTSVDLATLRGPLVLSLWQAGCAPCRKEMPALQAFHEQYAAQVPVVGVDFLDPFPGSALEEIKKRGITYPSLADPGGDLQGFAQFAKVPGMPTMYFVDARGEITYAKIGGVDSEAEVVDLVRSHLGVDL